MYSYQEVIMVSLDKAKAIALEDVGIPEFDEVIFTKEELHRNQGRRRHYLLSFFRPQ